MVKRNWVLEVEEYLNKKYIETIRDVDSCAQELTAYSPPLDIWEAKYFMLGLEKNFFSIDSEGYVQSNFLPVPPMGSGKQKMIQLFWNFQGGKRLLYREGVCQMATSSYLSIHHGWSASEIEMEPDIKEYGDLAYAVDILVKSDKGELAICCEVKKDDWELNKLIAGLRYCCEQGAHDKEGCKYRRDHQKFEICQALKPRYFYATSPQTKLCFELEYKENRIYLHEIGKPPSKAEYGRKTPSRVK